MKKILLLMAVFALLSSSAFAKAYFAKKEEMIKQSEYIAIVNIKHIEKTEQKGAIRTYHRKATGSVEKTLKGKIEADIEIFGMEDFICAQCNLSEGRFILFLRKDKNLWVCSNWSLGVRRIKNETVEWFKNADSPFGMEEKPLKEVISEIQNILKVKK